MKRIYILGLLYILAMQQAYSQNKPNAQMAAPAPSASIKSVPAPAGALKFNIEKVQEFITPVKTETEVWQAANQPVLSTQTISYTDGFGRPQQTQIRKANPLTKDLVQPYVYNPDGQTTTQLLPFAVAECNGYIRNVESGMQASYANMGYSQEAYLYGKVIQEESPLKRTLASYAPGNSWVGSNNGILAGSEFIAVTDVPRFTLNNANAIPVYAGTYTQLNVVTQTDEDYQRGKSAMKKSYYNVLGQLVCERTIKGSNLLTTCYVYDEYNQLRFTISPKAIEGMIQNGNVLSATLVENLCFSNTYDAYGRIIAVKKPEVGTTFTVYDAQDRPVLVQDANHRQANQWLFNKYDAAGRLIQSGVFSASFTPQQDLILAVPNALAQQYLAGNTYAYTRELLQYLAENNAANDLFLQYLFTTPVRAYSQYQTFSQAEVMQTMLYDAYDLVPYMPFSTFLAGRTDGYDTEKSSKIRGLLTATISKASDGSAYSVRTVMYYNSREELIQKAVRGTNNSLRFTAAGYDFAGRLIKSIIRHSKVEITRKFTFDTYGRLCKIEHKLNNNTNYRPIARYYYDDLGRMSIRKLGGMGYNLNYEYNIRNWISGINKNFVGTKNTIDYFGMEVFYDKGYDETYLNGRIAGIQWRNKGTAGEQRSYGYTYDFAGRMSLADYYQISETQPSDWLKTEKDFTASNMTYDANGNIMSMKHMGLDAARQIIILDDLIYTYAPNSNRLLGVAESASSQSSDPTVHDGLQDFRNMGNIGSTDYQYDANGNKNIDLNKGITHIENKWFGINKPLLVEFSNNNKIEFIYDASWTLLSKKITQASTNTVTRYDYAEDVTYKNGVIDGLSHEEGRIRLNTDDGTYSYDYFIKDPIDNVRSIITETQVNTWGGESNIDEVVWPTQPGPLSPVYQDGGAITENGLIAGGDGCTPAPMLYLATSEIQNDTLEELFFDNVDETRGDKVMSSETDDVKSANLKPAEGKILGPGILLKVMAGDQLQLGMEALYFNSSSPGTPLPVSSIVGSILGALSGTGGLMDGVANSSLAANLDVSGMTLAVSQAQNAIADSTKPRAFLNYLMFDEAMQVVPEESGAMQVQQANAWSDLSKPLFAINKNGYIYVYSCNRSEMMVRTDNLFIAHYQGSLLEEFHYYPYGLCFDVSKAPVLNQSATQKYNSQYIEQEEFEDAGGQRYGLDEYTFDYRSYDPQLGRWMQPDPLMQHMSPYLAMNNNPISFTDPSGLFDEIEDQIGIDNTGAIVCYGKENAPDIYSLMTSTGPGKWTTEKELTVEEYNYRRWLYTQNVVRNLRYNGQNLVYDVNGKLRPEGAAYNRANYKVNEANGAKANVQGGGGLDGKDWIGIGIGAAGFYNDVKGNALHNHLYWKGKTTGKIYTKNPFTSTKVGWKANSFKATGKVFQSTKSLGSKFGIAGLALTGADMVWGEGLTTSNMLDATFGVAGFIPGVGWMVSGSYFLINTGVQLYSGKSIGEHWDD